MNDPWEFTEIDFRMPSWALHQGQSPLRYSKVPRDVLQRELPDHLKEVFAILPTLESRAKALQKQRHYWIELLRNEPGASEILADGICEKLMELEEFVRDRIPALPCDCTSRQSDCPWCQRRGWMTRHEWEMRKAWERKQYEDRLAQSHSAALQLSAP